DLERLAGDGIGEGVVRHVVVGLVGRRDVVDLVAVVRLVVGDAAGPERGNALQHGPRMRFQPCLVTRRQVVLPLRDGDVGVDVDLAVDLPGEVRGDVHAG